MDNIYSYKGIHDGREQGQDGCEIKARPNMQEQFIEVLVVEVCKILRIKLEDNRVVRPIMAAAIKAAIGGGKRQEGLLDQYGAYVLDEAAERFYTDLKVPKDILVNHDNHDRSKYSSIIGYLQKVIEGPHKASSQ